MNFKELFITSVLIFFTFFLIIFSNNNFLAVKNGLVLWTNSIIPSLFPFLVVTELLTYTNFSYYLGKILNKYVKPIFNISGEGVFAIIMGNISGYPIGAKIAANFRKNNICSKEECERLLSFTNNSSPLFILGTIGISMFGNSTIGYLLLITHLLASFTVGLIFRFWKSNPKNFNQEIFEKSNINNFKQNIYVSQLGEIIGNSITKSINTLLLIGGFVVLFSVILSILKTSHLLELMCNSIEPFLRIFGISEKFSPGIISGFFEITNGLYIISNIPERTFSKNIIISSFLLGFGGLSVLLQVWSIISKTDLSIKPYIYGKILHSFISAFYTFLFIHYFIIFNFDL